MQPRRLHARGLAVNASTIDEALSMELDVMERQAREPRERLPLSPWHARRLFGFGASDVPALLVALRLRDAANAPHHVLANAAEHRFKTPNDGCEKWPRIVLEKAGVKAQLKAGRAAAIGTEREPELVAAWRDMHADDHCVDPRSVTHASIVPRELQSAVRDVACPFLSASLDAWGRDAMTKALLPIEAKCGHVERTALPWHWRAQVQAQLACTGLARGFVILGQMWARGPDVHGPIVTFEVERDELEIAEIRKAVGMCWSWVELIKKGVTAQ